MWLFTLQINIFLPVGRTNSRKDKNVYTGISRIFFLQSQNSRHAYNTSKLLGGVLELMHNAFTSW